jgi:hypothetical protein
VPLFPIPTYTLQLDFKVPLSLGWQAVDAAAAVNNGTLEEPAAGHGRKDTPFSYPAWLCLSYNSRTRSMVSICFADLSGRSRTIRGKRKA